MQTAYIVIGQDYDEFTMDRVYLDEDKANARVQELSEQTRKGRQKFKKGGPYVIAWEWYVDTIEVVE